MVMKLALALVPIVAVIASPAAANGYTDACAKEGTVLSGHVIDLTRITRGPDGKATPIETPIAHPKRGNAFYGTRSAVTLTFGGATYKLMDGSVFGLNCSGEAGATKLTEPDIEVELGSATVTAPAGHPTNVSAAEGAAFNYKQQPVEITLRRKLRGGKGFDDIVDRGPVAWALGTTKVTQSRQGYAGITPYVGRTPGECHYAHGALLKSTSVMSNGQLKGSAVWHGLAPFSPR